MERLLTIRDLKVWFPVRSGFLSGLMGKETKYVRALDGISPALRGGRAPLVERRLERATRSIEILEDRMEGLAAGKDATIKRLVSRLRRDIDLLRGVGPAFRPRTQKRLHRPPGGAEGARG